MTDRMLFPVDRMAQDVADFHALFNLPGLMTPGLLAEDMQRFRGKFLQEELDEFEEAWDKEDLAKAIDALLDEIYVALGTLHLMGVTPILITQCWTAIQAANMTKVRAPATLEGSVRQHTADVIKPSGWTPPDIAGIIERYRQVQEAVEALPVSRMDAISDVRGQGSEGC